ncbi:hypothetical protein CRG98_028419 [Punica granatum]|uniref:Uncharacterized protein n=1 Tax=Punica granatum TaxID=22663 RepID=A0A2I0J4G5_PUNGR|nr:hypothetical protein CRG98_028419 [Punica granatum]
MGTEIGYSALSFSGNKKRSETESLISDYMFSGSPTSSGAAVAIYGRELQSMLEGLDKKARGVELATGASLEKFQGLGWGWQ